MNLLLTRLTGDCEIRMKCQMANRDWGAIALLTQDRSKADSSFPPKKQETDNLLANFRLRFSPVKT
jgi:hypothetical protein